jgi:hypothetical protein
MLLPSDAVAFTFLTSERVGHSENGWALGGPALAGVLEGARRGGAVVSTACGCAALVRARLLPKRQPASSAIEVDASYATAGPPPQPRAAPCIAPPTALPTANRRFRDPFRRGSW